MCVPLGDHAAIVSQALCVSVSVFAPVVASHTCAAPSRVPVRKWVPSGDHAIASITLLVVSVNVSVLFPVVASHTCAVPSRIPVRM